MTLSGFVYLLLCAIFAVTANFLFRVAIGTQVNFSGTFIDYMKLAFQPAFDFGLLFYAFAMISWVKVLSSEPLNIAYPLLVSISFILVILGATVLFEESITTTKIAGILIIIVGIVITAQG